MVQLASYQKSVIIGILLSDGWLTFSKKTSKNARLGFKQSLAHFQYVWFVFNILSHYCSSSPNLCISIRAGTRCYALHFFTRAIPCITELHSLFYSNGIKIIQIDIYNMLTPVALAHWIMGDGTTSSSSGLLLCTDSYSIQDVVRLINVLIYRYDLKCNIRMHREGQYRIYISKKSMELLRTIVMVHMIPSMYYKVI